MALESRRELPRCAIGVAWLQILLLVSACGGGSPGVDMAALPPDPVPQPSPPPAPPPTSGSRVQFTIDDTTGAAADVPLEGGRVELSVPGGAAFAVNVPRGAFFAETTIELQSILDTQGLPQGLAPIAAVRLAPTTADFAVQPTIEIDLRGMPRPVGSVVVFMANADGTELTYLPPAADDPVALVTGDGPFAVRVPNFAAIGVAVSDPNGPGIPELDPGADGEPAAYQAVARRIDAAARQVLMGQVMLGAATFDVEPPLDAWQDDLFERAEALDVNTPFDDVKNTIREALRLEAARRLFNVTDQAVPLEGTALGLLLVRRLALQIETLNTRCVAGNSNASEGVDIRVEFLRRLASVDLLGDETLDYIESLDSCGPTLLPT